VEGLPTLQLIEPLTEGLGSYLVVRVDNNHCRVGHVLRPTHHSYQEYAVSFQS